MRIKYSTVSRQTANGGGVGFLLVLNRVWLYPGSVRSHGWGFAATGDEAHPPPSGGPPMWEGGQQMSFTRRFTTVFAIALPSSAQAETIYVDNEDCFSNCCVAHAAPGCDYGQCEALVCAILPSCCDAEWIAECATVAVVLCGEGCDDKAQPYCSIQAAIDNAVDTDEIVVGPGTYSEMINFLGKAITLHSSDGPGVTSLDAQGTGTVVTCDSGEGPDTVLEGFTIRGGSSSGMVNDGSSPTVRNCMFIDNSANLDTVTTLGGGMFNNNSSDPTVTDCVFIQNSAKFGGGGMFNNNGSSPSVINSMFADNLAGIFPSKGTGGGMYNNNSSNATVINCMFIENWADSGGGMFNDASAPTVTNCRFNCNSTDGCGGGVCDFGSSSSTVVNCTFSGNSAVFGGGGGMAGDGGGSMITNCIFWENSPNELVGLLGVSYSDVQGGFPGTGNIDADPVFADPNDGDFRLAPASPCIDAGDNTAVPEGVTTDLDGNPRFLEIPETPDTGTGIFPSLTWVPMRHSAADASRSRAKRWSVTVTERRSPSTCRVSIPALAA